MELNKTELFEGSSVLNVIVIDEVVELTEREDIAGCEVSFIVKFSLSILELLLKSVQFIVRFLRPLLNMLKFVLNDIAEDIFTVSFK